MRTKSHKSIKKQQKHRLTSRTKRRRQKSARKTKKQSGGGTQSILVFSKNNKEMLTIMIGERTGYINIVYNKLNQDSLDEFETKIQLSTALSIKQPLEKDKINLLPTNNISIFLPIVNKTSFIKGISDTKHFYLHDLGDHKLEKVDENTITLKSKKRKFFDSSVTLNLHKSVVVILELIINYIINNKGREHYANVIKVVTLYNQKIGGDKILRDEDIELSDKAQALLNEVKSKCELDDSEIGKLEVGLLPSVPKHEVKAGGSRQKKQRHLSKKIKQKRRRKSLRK